MRSMVQRGPIFLEIAHTGDGTTWYMLRSCYGKRTRVLLELEIFRDGRCIDLRKLDGYWGRVARPLLE